MLRVRAVIWSSVLVVLALSAAAGATPPPAPRWGPLSIVSSENADGASRVGVTTSFSANGRVAVASWVVRQPGQALGSLYARGATVLNGNFDWGPTTVLDQTARVAGTPPKLIVSPDGTHATIAWSGGSSTGDSTASASAVLNGNQASWGTVKTWSAPANKFVDLAMSADGSRGVLVTVEGTIFGGRVLTLSENTQSWTGRANLLLPTDAKNVGIDLSSTGTVGLLHWRRGAAVLARPMGVTADAITVGAAATVATSSYTGGGDNLFDLSGTGNQAVFLWSAGRSDCTQVLFRSAAVSARSLSLRATEKLGAPNCTGGKGFAAPVGVRASESAARTTILYSTSAYGIWGRSGSWTGKAFSWGPSTRVVSTTGSRVSFALSRDGYHVAVGWNALTSSTHPLNVRIASITSGTWSMPAAQVVTTQNYGAQKLELSDNGAALSASWDGPSVQARATY